VPPARAGAAGDAAAARAAVLRPVTNPRRPQPTPAPLPAAFLVLLLSLSTASLSITDHQGLT